MRYTANRPQLVVIGPSGAGKSTVVRALAAEGVLTVCPTWTTRPRRAAEYATCPEHHFVDETVFATLEKAGFFRATGTLAGLPYRYGLPVRTPHGPGVPTVMARAEHVAVLAGGTRTIVYQFAAPGPVLAARLAGRRTTRADVEARIATLHAELAAGRNVAHRSFDTDRPLPLVLDAVRHALSSDLRAVAA